MIEFFRKLLTPCLIGMEACATAHHWARELGRLGHTVRLMPASYVKAYVKRSKNDAADAAAICEAVTRPSMRFVPVKTAEQQAVLMLHRSRDLLVRQRTQLINALRAHLAEMGLVAATGVDGLKTLLTIVANNMQLQGLVVSSTASRGRPSSLEPVSARMITNGNGMPPMLTALSHRRNRNAPAVAAAPQDLTFPMQQRDASHLLREWLQRLGRLSRFKGRSRGGLAGARTPSLSRGQASEAGVAPLEAPFRDALTRAPGDPALLIEYAEALRAAGRVYDAMGVLARLNLSHPALADGAKRYADVYWKCMRQAERLCEAPPDVETLVPTTPSPPQNVTAWRRHLMQLDAIARSDPSIYVIGDSHAEFWPQEYLPHDALNLGNAGDKTQSVLWRLDEIEARGGLRPRPCVVVVGTNNLSMGDSAESIVAGLRGIDTRLRTMVGADQPLLFVALPPVGENGLFRAAERAKVNVLARSALPTVDFEPQIRRLGADAYLPDQIHLTAKAYSVMQLPPVTEWSRGPAFDGKG